MTLRVQSAALLVALILWPGGAFAFKLAPRGTKLEQSVAKKHSGWFDRVVLLLAGGGVDVFTAPVHEEITQRSYGCNGNSSLCGAADAGFASDFVLAGVRWNDDPPFRLDEGAARDTSCKVVETVRFTTQPVCWTLLFRDAQRRAAAGQRLDASGRFSLLHRSHFGDLQFLHAMASADGESPEETRRRILMWAEFTWRAADGEFALGAELRAVTVEGFDRFFASSGWRLQDLFTLGNVSLRRNVREVAFGSLLHTVQDSFAKSHVERIEPTLGETCPGTGYPAPGAVREFHAYNGQSTHLHAAYDALKAFQAHFEADSPSVVDVGRVLVDLFSRDAVWEAARPYMECVLRLDSQARPSSAGQGFHP